MIRPVLLLIALAGLVACAAPPSATVSSRMRPGADFGLGQEVAEDVAGDWWQEFQDPTLNDLIERAIRNAPSVEAAQAALESASADLDSVQSARGLSMDAGVTEDRQHFSARSYIPPPWGGSTYWNGTIGADLHWDLDVYGRISRRVSAAGHERDARRSQLRGARLMVEAGVTTAYVDWLRARRDVQVAEAILGEREAVLGLLKQRAARGLVATAEVTSAEAERDAARQDLVRYQAEVPLAMHRLGALTGLGANLTTLPDGHVNESALTVPTVLPGDLLTRRGDIKAAAARVAGAVDREELARLARYPEVDLHGFVGATAFGLDSLLSAPSRMLIAGAGAMLPLYDHGRIDAGRRAAGANTAQALAAYNQTVLEAIRETADALTRVAAREQEVRHADALVVDANRLLGDVQRRRVAGLADERAVIQARIAALIAAVHADDLRLAAAQSRVSVLVAIGGSGRDPSILSASTSKVSP